MWGLLFPRITIVFKGACLSSVEIKFHSKSLEGCALNLSVRSLQNLLSEKFL